ncbi:aminoglycoside phosphotransferase family protein [Pandoraea pulmonicola]|uniref:Aminoglycoside/hydroxyurea antibiotic resistance kinase n=1 Tax=Pandoraea pulmonicola TaxID=93221 RepID=A0AAJ5D2P0_PANPU|nr:aminoglycoside phosphotransferase family protein [Pandoraea pulmonicola]AJC22796.1 hypothetical protein RO07_24270 [Pandoraea pulmonicola]SUA92917.1 Aminoglycoside/hydroxyurea antibiotic resistance kinase [Pandoraea pulmonicola]
MTWFEPYLARWRLRVDGEPFASKHSHLLPVRRKGVAAMLKVSHEKEERDGSALMAWWNGDGAAPVLEHDAEALLMLRADGRETLVEMSRQGRDDAATDILCAVVARLHRPRRETLPPLPPLPPLIPLTVRFSSLLSSAEGLGRPFVQCADVARALLATPQDVMVLHGDIHHGNVLDFGAAGWLAIDPKGLYGERGFDYANLFCNPDAQSALAPGVFDRRVERVARIAGLAPERLLRWVMAWAGLSAVWMLEDGDEEDGEEDGEVGVAGTLSIARRAAASLGIEI